MPRRRFRDRLPFRPDNETAFTWRSRGSSLLENLSDAVFGFALTLLVVSTEAPRNFASLVNILREFPAFVACFAVLMYLWNEHYRYFRRYGLEDMTTRMLNYAVLLLVVFSIYPLKFLFTGWFRFMFGPRFGPTVGGLSLDELYALYIVYGTGMAAIYMLFALLFRHAWSKRHLLQLTEVEQLHTQASIAEFTIHVLVCITSVVLAALRVHPILPGMIYASLGVFMGISGARFGRRIHDASHTPPLAA